MESTIFEKQRLSAREVAAPPRRRPRLLCVDDDTAILRLIRSVLTRDYDLELAPDGEAGLRLAIASPPDLIMSDFDMPRMTGRELLRAVRASASLQSVPFIVLTAIGDHQLRLELLRDGAQDFLVKPFSVEELRVRVANLVHMKIARDLLQKEVESRSSDLQLLVAGVAERRAALQVAQEQAQTASRAKSDFLTLVSHELKTPLTVLRLSVDIWQARTSQARLASDRELRRFTGAIVRLENLVESLLEASRIQSGRLELRVEEIDAGDLLDRLALDLETQIQAKGLSLRIDVSDDARRVRSDSRLLWLIMSNLLGNAIRYTDAGEIAVRVYRAHGTVLEVRDTGRGISQEDAERIFEPFIRVEPIEHHSSPGVGLGLALVRDLVAALGGKVELESEPGVGSMFRVILPGPGAS